MFRKAQPNYNIEMLINAVKPVSFNMQNTASMLKCQVEK